MRNALYLETEQRWQKRVLSFFFFFSSMLVTKITKHMQSILFEVTKRHSQRCVISVFLNILATKKTYKNIENTLYGKIKHYQIHVFWVVLSFFRTKRLKQYNTLYRETEQHYQKMCFFIVLRLLGNKTPKSMIITRYGETKRY